MNCIECIFDAWVFTLYRAIKPNPNSKLHHRMTAFSEINLNKPEQNSFARYLCDLNSFMMSRNLLYMPGSFAKRILTWSRYDKASSTLTQRKEKQKRKCECSNAWSDTTGPEKKIMGYNEEDLWNDTWALKKKKTLNVSHRTKTWLCIKASWWLINNYTLLPSNAKWLPVTNRKQQNCWIHSILRVWTLLDITLHKHEGGGVLSPVSTQVFYQQMH